MIANLVHQRHTPDGFTPAGPRRHAVRVNTASQGWVLHPCLDQATAVLIFDALRAFNPTLTIHRIDSGRVVDIAGAYGGVEITGAWLDEAELLPRAVSL